MDRLDGPALTAMAPLRRLPPRVLKQPLRYLRDRVRNVRDRLHGLPPAGGRGFIGGGDFKTIGKEFVDHFINLAGLQPSDHVLDIGCGFGRMAIPLTRFLRPPGGYEGFDITKTGVAWCQRHIGRRHSHFRFTHVDLRNTLYNPRGALDPAAFQFPYADGAFDFVFATSVFTHLVPLTTTHYLHEVGRVLRACGRSLLTFFVLDDESRSAVQSGKSSQPFVHAIHPAALTTNAENPETAVAYDEQWLRSALEISGLKILEPIRWGSWSGRANFLSYQDIVTSVKE